MTQKKRVLVVINSMELGGAQKSLVSFLKSMKEQGFDAQYDMNLLIAKPVGLFMEQIPPYVHQLTPPAELVWLGTERHDALLKRFPTLRGNIGKLRWMASNKQRFLYKKLNEEQRIWKNWKQLIRPLQGHYDIAISYMNGFPSYFVMDKVSADRKILWIHNEYEKLRYDTEFDRSYYAAADGIITISEVCCDSFLRVFPAFANKISVLENITLASDVRANGEKKEAPEFERTDAVKILSVGRLCEQKQFELTVRAAKVLKERGLRFLWVIVGDGPDRAMLENKISQCDVSDCFLLVGLKDNPYSYMARCDVFVQTSRFEGKSMVLDEVKLFRKPIIITNYPSAADAISDGENGLICPMNAESIADAVERIVQDAALRKRFAAALEKENGNSKELNKYLKIML